MKIRLQIMRWLYKLSKTPEGMQPPKWLDILYKIFYPLRALYQRQANIRYDVVTNSYWLEGQRYSVDFFKFFSAKQSLGTFTFNKDNQGIITVTKISL